MCGGTAYSLPKPLADLGLSPRVRGNPVASRFLSLRVRSIPACAGEPDRWQRYRSENRVYPRVCGGTAILLCRQRH